MLPDREDGTHKNEFELCTVWLEPEVVPTRTDFFVLFSVFKKRMTRRSEKLRPGGALVPWSSDQGDRPHYPRLPREPTA